MTTHRSGLDSKGSRPLAAASTVALLGLVLVSTLVATGQLSGMDSFGVEHLMPFSTDPGAGHQSFAERVIGYQGGDFRVGQALLIFAEPVPAAVLALFFCGVLWRQGSRGLAALWIGAVVVATLSEAIGKLLIVRPQFYAPYNGSLVPAGFHDSFPSGHAARGVVLVSIATCLWRRLLPLFLVWLTAMIVAMQLQGSHTPSDIAGGLLLGSMLTFGVLAADRKWGAALDQRWAKGKATQGSG